MAVLRTRITGPVCLPDGSTPPDGGKIIFTLTSWDKTDDTVVMHGPTEAPIVSGAIDLYLHRTAAGTRQTPYAVTYHYFSGVAGKWLSLPMGVIAIAGSGPYELADLLSVPAPESTQHDALALALAAAQAALDNADRAEAAKDASALSETNSSNSATSAALSSAAAGTASGRLEVATFAELATVFGYTSAGGRRAVAAGDMIRVLAIGAMFDVLASGAPLSHLDYTGSGGVKLNVRPDIYGYRPADAFGAAGDGVTNDAAALNKAGTIGPYSLRAGATYLASTLVTTAYPVRGNGATIAGQIEVTASGAVLDRLNVVSPVAAYGVYLKGLSGARISNVKMLGCTVSFSGGTPADRLGVLAQHVDNLVIDGCSIDFGANLIRCYNYRFTNNMLDGKYQNHNELLHSTVRSYGIISGNTFKDSLDNWIDLYSSGEKTVVVGNRFSGCYSRLGTGFEIKVTLSDDPNNTSGGPNDYGFAENIIIADNYFGGFKPNNTSQAAILSVYYIDTRASPSFSWANVPKMIRIDGNIFDSTDTTNAGAATVNGVYLWTVEGVAVTNNDFRRFSIGGSASVNSACVWIEGCNNVTVHDNTMSIKDGCGILIQDVCDNLSIQGNRVVDDLAAGTGPAYGVLMTKIGSRPSVAVTNSIISNNRLSGSVSSIRCAYTAGTITDTVVAGNVCDNETVLEAAVRCTVANNNLAVKSTRFRALGLGNSTANVARYNLVTGNIIKTPSGSAKPAMEIYRMRASTITGNIMHNASDGMLITGTGTAGELDNLIIKDNQSVSQTGASFPRYVSMHATDTASLSADTNRMVA